MSVLQEEAGGGEAGRPRADDRNLFAGWDLRRDGVDGFRPASGVAHRALKRGDGDGIIQVRPPAGPLAEARTHATERRVEEDALARASQGVLMSPAGKVFQHPRDVETGGARDGARALAVAVMFGQQQFERRAPGVPDVVRFTGDDHPVDGDGGACRVETWPALDLHDAHVARSAGLAAVGEAEGGDLDAESSCGIEDRASLRTIHGFSVDREPGDYSTFTASAGQTPLQVPQRMQRSVSISWTSYGFGTMASAGHFWAQRVQPMQSSVIE